MIGVWLLYLLALPLTLLGGMLATKGGRRYLKKIRRKAFRNGVKATKSAIRHKKKAYAGTARGQLAAKRKKQDYRLGFGHVRKEGDETRTRKVAQKVRDKAKAAQYQAKVNKANRDAQWVPDQPVSKSVVPTAYEGYKYHGLCGAKTTKGTPCQHPTNGNTKRCPAGHTPRNSR